MDDLVAAIIAIIGAVASFFGGGFVFKMKYKKTTLTNSQTAENAGVNLRDVNNSTISINAAVNEAKPVKVDSIPALESKSTVAIRDLVKRIGKEKISILLQEAKLIAIDTEDREMQRWIEYELNGYVSEGKESVKASVLPDYRRIKGKFLVQIGDGSIHDLDYPLPIGHSIKSIESYIDKLNQGGFRITQKVTVPKDIEEFGGKDLDIEIPLTQLQSIITGVEGRLSKYLESKILE